MFFIGSRMLPARRSVDSLTENYELKDYLTEIVIEKDSRLIGKRFKQTVLIDDMHLEVIEITSHDGSIWLPDAYEILEAGDKLLVRGSRTDIAMIKAMKGVVFAPEELIEDLDLKSNETTLIEVVVAPNSSIARSSINEINFKDLYDAIPLALRRKGVLMNEKFSDMELRFGDDILLEVKKDSIDQLKRSYDFVFTQELDKVEFNPKKMYLSVAVLFGVILLAAFNILPIIVGALIGIIILVLADCITIREAYRQVDWKIIFVLACLIPLGTALTNSGAADQLAGSILDYLSDLGPLYILFFLFILTALTTSIMSNAATAVLLCPVAISLAAQMSLDPKPFLFTIMFAASTCYLTPVGYQGNILIYGPGNYKFADFVRVGGLFTVISMFVVVFMLYSIYF
ncbi:MAG: anion permease [Bacteroidetes bacterium]|nr:anion permease [Bacteroidota bacterium]